MTVFNSIKNCFKKYIDFNGRASRSEYWFFIWFFALVWIGLLFIGEYWDDSNYFYELSDNLYSLLNYLIYGLIYGFPLICLIPLISVTIRRIHDIGHSGFIICGFALGIFFGFILESEIILRIIVTIFGLFLLQKSSGKNKFGPVPKK